MCGCSSVFAICLCTFAKMSPCQGLPLSVCMYVCLHVCLSICLSVNLSAFLSVCLPFLSPTIRIRSVVHHLVHPHPSVTHHPTHRHHHHSSSSNRWKRRSRQPKITVRLSIRPASERKSICKTKKWSGSRRRGGGWGAV